MEPAIHLRSAVSLLGRFPALAGVDLEVMPGETVLIQGPNGAGKTTLLKACAGLVPVVAGEARVLGHDLRSKGRPARDRIGYLGHSTGLYDELTVADNLRFWTRAARASMADAEAASTRLGLDGRLADVAVAKLSAGQRRRVAIACLLARRPLLWLLDEPHAGLDNDTRDVVDDLVGAAVRAGATVVIASHDRDRAEVLTDRHVTINGGVVTADTADTAAPDATRAPESTGATAATGAGTGGPDPAPSPADVEATRVP